MPGSKKEHLENLNQKKTELEKALTEAKKSLGEYGDFISKLNKLNEEMTKLYKYQDDRSMIYPAVDSEMKKKLIELYQDVGIHCDKYLASDGAKNLEGVTKIVNDIRGIVKADSETLFEYNPEMGKLSLPTIISNARTETLDLGENNIIPKVGGAQNSRMAFSYTDSVGVVHEGIFTPKRVVHPEEDFKKIFSDIDKKYPGNFGTQFYNFYIKNANAKEEEKERAYVMMKFCAYAAGQSAENIYNLLKRQNKELPDKMTQEFKTVVADWRAQLKAIYKVHGINVINSYIMGESRIDSRNTAMSRVADMLGVPDILARSKPMKIKYNGVETEGTFMEKGDGININYITEESKSYSERQLNGDGLKSVADLQVLDFLCGNTDRHIGNLMFKFDTSNSDPKMHKFLKIQGIDNDCALGELVPASEFTSRSRMTAIASMSVISKSMAEAILSMNAEALKFQLRDLGISDLQLDALEKRLDMLKNTIKNSQKEYEREKKIIPDFEDPHNLLPNIPRIIDDEDFRSFTIDELVQQEELSRSIQNTFGYVAAMPENISGSDKVRELQMKKISVDKGLFIPTSELKNVNNALTGMQSVTASDSRTSEEFESLREAMNDYREFVETTGGMILSTHMQTERSEKLEIIRNRAIKYLEHKSRDENFRAGTVEEAAQGARSVMHMGYANKRINLVEKIGTWADQQVEALSKINDPLREEFNRFVKTGDRGKLDEIHRRDDMETEMFNNKMKELAMQKKAEAEANNNINIENKAKSMHKH